MKILAFMQNPWFPPGTADRHIQLYRTNQQFHRRLLASTMSGRRLKMAFGALFDQIIWDNANWRPTWVAAEASTPDIEHIIDVIRREVPELVLAIGKQAQVGVAQAERAYFNSAQIFTVLSCHHPNARGKTQCDLNAFADTVRAMIR